jgi:3alpha(or 20beta)-hydroxysteroid dehydrogenase
VVGAAPGAQHIRPPSVEQHKEVLVGQRMHGKVALISGAARGQGAAHALRLAGEGASVLCTDVLDELGQETAEAIAAKGFDAAYLHLDVRSNQDWAAAVAEAERRWGKLDVLVNNAGIVAISDVETCTDEEWDDVLAVCQNGVFRGTRAAIPALRRAGGGSIVNTASVYGLRGVWGYAAYQTAKAGVLAITRSTAKTYGHEGIRANAVCPGVVQTPMLEAELEIFASNPHFDFERDHLPLIPLGARVAQPEEISEIVLHLASDESRYTTGSAYVVDGGLTI